MKKNKIELIVSSADAAFHQAQDGLIFRAEVDATAAQVDQAQATARATFQAICQEAACCAGVTQSADVSALEAG